MVFCDEVEKSDIGKYVIEECIKAMMREYGCSPCIIKNVLETERNYMEKYVWLLYERYYEDDFEQFLDAEKYAYTQLRKEVEKSIKSRCEELSKNIKLQNT